MNQQTNPNSRDGKATTAKKTFSRETSVSTTIQADPAIVWALLTHASDFPRWNSTVTSMTGEIREGGNVELKSILDDKRTFKLKIKEFVPEKRLAWGDVEGEPVDHGAPALFRRHLDAEIADGEDGGGGCWHRACHHHCTDLSSPRKRGPSNHCRVQASLGIVY